jgi:hypothetical protein
VQEPDLAKAYREELDKLSQRNYELRMENAELKATPPAAQRQWVDLKDEEMREFDVDPIEAKLMIAKLKEKNTP